MLKGAADILGERLAEALARVAELEADKEKLIGYGDVLGLRVRQAEARVAELEAELIRTQKELMEEQDQRHQLERKQCDCGMKS